MLSHGPGYDPAMEPDRVKDYLDQERHRLADIRTGFDEEHLTTESEAESLAELSSNAQDLGTETFNRERDLSILEHIDAELADVEHALRRLDDGTYGTCEACGKPIGDERLEAMPAARFCLDDRSVAERRLVGRMTELTEKPPGHRE
jgi:RNA polymerase-binding transcription factor DksA